MISVAAHPMTLLEELQAKLLTTAGYDAEWIVAVDPAEIEALSRRAYDPVSLPTHTAFSSSAEGAGKNAGSAYIQSGCRDDGSLG
jgi:hypothetical protein